MERRLEVCERCALFSEGNCVFSRKAFLDEPKKPIVLFVGEAPGKAEVLAGEVFAGESGALLEEVLKENDLLPHAVLSNAIRCAPSLRGERWWDNPQILCDRFLFEEISEVNPDIVVALGEGALFYLLGRKKKKVALGRVFQLQLPTGKVINALATYNPAFVLRRVDRYIEETFREHIRRVRDLISATKEDLALIERISDCAVYEKHDLELESFLNIVAAAQKGEPSHRIALDIEVGSFNNDLYDDIGKSPTSEILLVGIGTDKLYRGFVLWQDGKKVFDIREWRALKEFLTSGDFWIYMHNAAFEVGWFLRTLGVYPKRFIDTQMFAHLLNENLQSYSLEFLARAFGLEVKDFRWKEWVKEESNYARIPIDKLVVYNFFDVTATFMLGERLRKELLSLPHEHLRKGMLYFLTEIQPKISTVVAHITATGIPASLERQQEVLSELKRRQEDLEDALREHAPQVKNFLSTPQVYEYLKSIGVSEVEQFKTEKGNPSLTKKVIESLIEMRPDVEFLRLLLDYRETIKLASTYVKSLPNYVHRITQRIYPNLHTTGTKTGRLSASNPPLQNYPSERLALGKLVRKMFTAPEGYSFITCDAKQHELRVLAVLSKDENLMNAFLSGEDVHAYNASRILNKPVSEITPEERQMGKRLSFAVVYGVTPEGAVDIFKLSSVEEARQLLESIKNAFPKAARYMERMQREILRPPHAVMSPLGRVRRPLAEWSVRRGRLREDSPAVQRAMRQAGNFVIQSMASDLWCLVAYHIFEKIHEHGWDKGLIPAANICILIHDSLYIVCRNELVEPILEIIKGALAYVSLKYFRSEDLPITAEYAVYGRSVGDEALYEGEWSVDEIKRAIAERLWEKRYNIELKEAQIELVSAGGNNSEVAPTERHEVQQLSLFD